MNEIQKFRTSFGGFHRGDVAEYIERTANAHSKQIAQLQERLAEAERKLAEAESERDCVKAVLRQLDDAYAAAKAALAEEG